MEYAGEEAASKLKRIRKALREKTNEKIITIKPNTTLVVGFYIQDIDNFPMKDKDGKDTEISVHRVLLQCIDNIDPERWGVAKGEWADLGGQVETLKLEKGDYVGLPTGEESWGFKTFTVDEYTKLVEAIRAGEVVVSDALEAPAVDANVTVTYID